MAAPAAAAAMVSREEFEDEFKVMFEFYRWWGRMSKEEENRTNELSAYYEKQGVQWSDRNGKLLPIPAWVVRRVVQWSECDFRKAKKMCMFYNHPAGHGCMKKEGKECGYIHKCIFCESQNHGLYFCRPNGQYVCPRLKEWEKEVTAFKEKYGEPVDEVLKALARPPRQRRRQLPTHPAKRMNLSGPFDCIASSDSEVYELKTSESDEGESRPAREVSTRLQHEAQEMAEPLLEPLRASAPADSGYDSADAKELGDSDSDGRVVSSFNKQPVRREVPPVAERRAPPPPEPQEEGNGSVPPGLERRAPPPEIHEEGNRYVSDTGSMPIGVSLPAEDGELTSCGEQALRTKLGLKFRGDRNAFHSSAELVRFLQDNSYTDELRVYRNRVELKKRANHLSDGDGVQHPLGKVAEPHMPDALYADGTWPMDLTITDLHRSGTRREKLLLELLCLRIRFVPGAIARTTDVFRILARRVQVEVRDVLSFRDGYWAVAFSASEDVERVMCDSSSLTDIIQDVQHYRAQPTKRDNTVWFFNFLMCKIELAELQAKMETYGPVKNVHPINYHSNEHNIVMNGWVEFRELASVQQLMEEVDQNHFFYQPTKKNYTVLHLGSTMVSIMRDHKGSAQGSADWLDAAPPLSPSGDLSSSASTTKAVNMEPVRPPGLQALPQLSAAPPQKLAPWCGLAPSPPARELPVSKPAPPYLQVNCPPPPPRLLREQPACSSEAPLPPPLREQRPLCSDPPPPLPPPMREQPVCSAETGGPDPPPPLAPPAPLAPPGPLAPPVPREQFVCAPEAPLPPPQREQWPWGAPEAPLPPPQREQRPLGAPEAPLPPPQREQRPLGVEQPVSNLLDELEEQVAGVRQVLEKAKLIQLNKGQSYVAKLLEWVCDNEAAELEELLKHSEQITSFMELKSLPAERFTKALQQALQAV